MKNDIMKTFRLGELIAAVFDETEEFSSDPHRRAHLVSRVVAGIMRHARQELILSLRQPLMPVYAVCAVRSPETERRAR